MESSSIKIFLLRTKNGEEKIVWADNEEEARIAANNTTLKRKEPGNNPSEISKQDQVYLDDGTQCQDITSQIKDLKPLSNVHFKYRDIDMHLSKNIAEKLNKLDIKLFLLAPNHTEDNFHSVLIWADNESDARKYAGSSTIKPAKPAHLGQNESETEDMLLNQDFYKSQSNASCRQLSSHEFTNLIPHNNEMLIQFNRKNYALKKNEPQQA